MLASWVSAANLVACITFYGHVKPLNPADKAVPVSSAKSELREIRSPQNGPQNHDEPITLQETRKWREDVHFIVVVAETGTDIVLYCTSVFVPGIIPGLLVLLQL